LENDIAALILCLIGAIVRQYNPMPNPALRRNEMPRSLTKIATVPASVAGEITANLRQHAAAARGAYAGNSERALKANVAIWR
jgi:hypothetical protein